jgi:hypothetical protein
MKLYIPDAVFHTTEGGRFSGASGTGSLFEKALAANGPDIRMTRSGM